MVPNTLYMTGPNDQDILTYIICIPFMFIAGSVYSLTLAFENEPEQNYVSEDGEQDGLNDNVEESCLNEDMEEGRLNEDMEGGGLDEDEEDGPQEKNDETSL